MQALWAVFDGYDHRVHARTDTAGVQSRMGWSVHLAIQQRPTWEPQVRQMRGVSAMVDVKSEDLEVQVDKLAGRAEKMSKQWCADLTSLIVDGGEPGAAVALACLIQLTRAVLEHLPPESRGMAVSAIATHGVDVTPAISKVAS